MRSNELTGDQLEALGAKVRPMLRYVRKLASRMDHVLDAQDPLRLKTVAAADKLQHLLTELHYLGVKPGQTGRQTQERPQPGPDVGRC